MDEENDLFYHALNYRGASSQNAELFWNELEACVSRLIAAEREACAKACESLDEAEDCAVVIRMRSNVQGNRLAEGESSGTK